ncbi:MAG: hypothetical protein ACJ76Z_15300 [Thermoleophilaceae bacterium]
MRARVAAGVAFAAVVVAVLVVALHRSGTPPTSGALADALGYMPKDAAVVAVVQTDPHGRQLRSAGKLLGQFPGGAGALGVQVLNALRARVPALPSDLRPLLGRPLVVGLARPPPNLAAVRADFVVAIHVDHPTRVKQILVRQPNLLPRGKTAGRRVFEDRFGARFAAAVDGHAFVAAGSRPAIDGALTVRRSAARLSERDFDDRLLGLPEDAGVRVAADAQALLATSRALRPTLAVPWMASLRRVAATAAADGRGVEMRFRADTDRSAITDAELPLAPRSATLPLIGHPDELAIGLEQPRRTLDFAAAIARRLAPARAARVDALLRSRGIALGRDVGARLGSTASIAIDPLGGSWAARIALRDPAGMRALLQEIADGLPDIAAAAGVSGVGVAAPAAGSSFYALARPGGSTVVFGVVGSSLVVANRARRAAGLSREPSHIAPAAPGSLAVDADARVLAARYLARTLSGLAGLGAPFAVRALGHLAGSVAADRAGIHGRFRLAIR